MLVLLNIVAFGLIKVKKMRFKYVFGEKIVEIRKKSITFAGRILTGYRNVVNRLTINCENEQIKTK